jgi:hypothetical protein
MGSIFTVGIRLASRFHAGIFLELLNPEDGSGMFIRNIFKPPRIFAIATD